MDNFAHYSIDKTRNKVMKSFLFEKKAEKCDHDIGIAIQLLKVNLRKAKG